MIKYPSPRFFNELDRKLQNILSVFDRVCDIEVIATSGLRTPEHNAEVHGSPTSSHLKGLAIDLATPDSKVRDKVLKCSQIAGFTRRGMPKSGDHIHLDIDPDKVQDVFFIE